jgi:Fe2+ transport system protein FeoA
VRLSIVKPGGNVRIIAVESGCGLQKRLADLGVMLGSEVEVIENHMNGPILIATRGAKLMLGRTMSEKIFVR